MLTPALVAVNCRLMPIKIFRLLGNRWKCSTETICFETFLVSLILEFT
jgi:hypothetical protein